MRGACFVLGALFANCTPSDVPATQVVVLVGGDARVDKLDVRVYPAEGGMASSARAISLTRRKPGGLPSSFTVVPADGGAATSFRIVVQGVASDAQGNTSNLARSEAVARFSRHATVLLPLVLSPLCRDERCGCAGSGPCDRTCEAASEGVQCVDVPRFDTLPEIEPGGELFALGEGLAGCSRGSLPASDGTCRDLDECAFALDACTRAPAACVNESPALGRYRCACPPGYSGSGEADDPCVACAGGDCAESATRG